MLCLSFIVSSRKVRSDARSLCFFWNNVHFSPRSIVRDFRGDFHDFNYILETINGREIVNKVFERLGSFSWMFGRFAGLFRLLSSLRFPIREKYMLAKNVGWPFANFEIIYPVH